MELGKSRLDLMKSRLELEKSRLDLVVVYVRVEEQRVQR